MDNELIEKLIENISEEEIIELEEEMFFNKNIPQIDNEKIINIKIKSREKYNNKNKKTLNIKKLIRESIVFICIVIFFGSATMAILEKINSYATEERVLTPNSKNMYVMEKSIMVNENEQYLNLKSAIWSNKDKAIFTTLEGNGLLPGQEGLITINDKKIKSNSYCLANGSENWRLGHIFNVDFKFNEGDKVNYSIVQDDEKKVSFDINFVKSDGNIDYKKLGPSNVKEGIAVIGIINEKDNVLDVNFAAVVEGKDSEVIKYGKELHSDNFESGIVLIDSNGKKVKGEEIYHGDRNNNFKFDTTDLVKPYEIIIPQVTLGIYDMENNNSVIKLKLPKEGKLDVDKEIKLEGSNYIGMDNNRTIKIMDIQKVKNNTYEIKIEFPFNKDNKIKISALRINPISNINNYRKDFKGYGEELDYNNILKKITIKTTNENKKYIRFNLKPKYYIVEGNWNLEIE